MESRLEAAGLASLGRPQHGVRRPGAAAASRCAATAIRPRRPSGRAARRRAAPAARSPASRRGNIGSSMIPVSIALQPVVPPAQRTPAGSRCAGPGIARRGEGVGPRPMSPLRGPAEPCEQPRDGIACSRRSSRPRRRRRPSMARVVLAHRAVLPVGVAALVREPGAATRLVGLQARRASPLAPRSPYGCLRCGRQGMVVQHARRPSGACPGPRRSRPCSGRRRRSGRRSSMSVMIALSAGGRSAATWRLLKPPQEMPIMPTSPVAPGLRGEPRR